MPRILFILQSAFSLWMLVDAVRKHRDRVWYMIILLPFGELAYFFMIKLNDPDMAWPKQMFRIRGSRPPSVEQIRHAAEQTSSFQNTLLLAQALHDRDAFAEAETWFRRALCREPASKPALRGLALCRIGQSKPDDAVAPLEQIIDRDPTYAEWAVWHELPTRYGWAAGDKRRWIEWSSWSDAARAWPIGCTTPEPFIEVDRAADARRELDAALGEHEHAPRFQKRRERRPAREARRLLAELDAEAR